MKKIKTIKIEEFEGGSLQNTPSKITLKRSRYKRKITIRNDGGNWVNPKAKRVSIVIRDSIKTEKPEVSIEVRGGQLVSMSFLDLCDIYDIMKHQKDLGLNLTTETRVVENEQ